jgi:hypothetical protein
MNTNKLCSSSEGTIWPAAYVESCSSVTGHGTWTRLVVAEEEHGMLASQYSVCVCMYVAVFTASSTDSLPHIELRYQLYLTLTASVV